jgi:hypothetical protein
MTLVGNSLSDDDIKNFHSENSIQEYYCYYATDGNTPPFSLPQNMHAIVVDYAWIIPSIEFFMNHFTQAYYWDRQ